MADREAIRVAGLHDLVELADRNCGTAWTQPAGTVTEPLELVSS
jgi:hypothetical protein